MQVASYLNAHPPKPLSGGVIKTLCCISLIIITNSYAFSQNVGVGTSAPQKKLTVRGSIMLDQGNHNTGTLDSAALLFGSAGTVGITSRKSGAGSGGLSIWTGGQEQLTISSSGNVGVNGAYSASHALMVNGNTNLAGTVTAANSINSGGSITAMGSVTAENYLIADNAVRAMTRAGIGGVENNAYRLYVHDGHSYFQGNISVSGNNVTNGNTTIGGITNLMGNVNVAGTFSATDNLVIKGTGSVRSEGPSPLRIGFETFTFNGYVDYDPHESSTHIINLADFASASDVRVLFSSYLPGTQLSLSHFNRFRFSIIAIDPDANTASLRILNDSESSSTLQGTVHLLTVMKDN